MAHKCQYCDKAITQGTTVEGVKCVCDVNPSICEVPDTVICDGPLCQFQFQVEFYESKLATLKTEIKDHEPKLKELVNIYRLMGITPKGLEVLIQTQGVNTEGLMIAQNSEFSWDKLPAENIVTIGLHFFQNMDRITKLWLNFVNEKAAPAALNKDHIAKTSKNLAKAKGIREGKLAGDNGNVAKVKKPKLSSYEAVLLQNCKVLNLDQEAGMKLLDSMNIPRDINVRNLKDLGVL